MPAAINGIYAITPELPRRRRELTELVAAALRGGVGTVQYRDKSEQSRRRRREAQALAVLCAEAGACFIVNDDPELARQVGAQGVHLGQQDASIARARDILGERAMIGATCHASLELAAAAAVEGADYLAFGRFFPSTTKASAPTARLEILSAARLVSTLPLVAIGGIVPGNIERVIRAGAQAVAIAGGLFDCSDPGARARALCRAFAHHSRNLSQEPSP